MSHNQNLKSNDPDVRYSGQGVRRDVAGLFPESNASGHACAARKIKGFGFHASCVRGAALALKGNASALFANLSSPRIGTGGMLLAFNNTNRPNKMLNFLQLFFETNETPPKAQ